MRELTPQEVAEVNGGIAPIIFGAIGVAGAIIKFGYDAGRDMAARDNRTMGPVRR